jgi:hypothetical protein
MNGFKTRSDEQEIMDDMTMNGIELRRTLDLLASINLWLGGNSLIMEGIGNMLKDHPKDRTVRIVDLGCGNGDMLRRLHAFGERSGYRFELLGIDANEAAVSYAEELSRDLHNVRFKALNIFSEEFAELDYDIAIATLFLHHFSDMEITALVSEIRGRANKGVLVNDLHRSELAYALFWVISLFFRNKVARNDGLLSIRKAFRRRDLEKYAESIPGKSSIKWKWAFRYQWIITNK